MWPHLFSATLKTCRHFLTVPAEWGISPLWSLGGIKPSCNTPQGHNTSYTQPAPLAHTAIPLSQLFLLFKTQTHHSYFFNFLTLRVAHPQGDRTRVAHPSPLLAEVKTSAKRKKDKQQTVDKQTNTQPDQDMQMCQNGTSQSLLTGLSESPSHFPRCPQSPWWSLLHP